MRLPEFALILALVAGPALAQDLPSWNDGPRKQAIVDFVTAATTEGGPGWIAPQDRIATFDNDGTLWAEQPLYFQGLFAIDRIQKLAVRHPEWKLQQPFKDVLEGDLKAVAASGGHGATEILAVTHAWMTADAFEGIVNDWIKTARHPQPEGAAMLNRALAQAAGIVHHDWLVLIVSDFDGADDLTFAMLAHMARGNDLVLALVHDPAAHEVPRQGRVVVGDGELQVALDLSSEPVRRNLAEARRERLRGLIAWQHRLPLSVLPVSAGEETLPQLQRLFAAPARQGTRGFDTPRGAA
ncbi:hypothetical protein E2976_04615 (plasmid) [Paracoccus yeei]|uniref:DUF58 domain-containing protein n=1 Tax=Paracoccus yeei TaxID=147645 RepID=UPI003BF8DDFA